MALVQKDCLVMGVSYEWSSLKEECDLECERVERSVSRVSYGRPQECACE
jgi:hypothetical protein